MNWEYFALYLAAGGFAGFLAGLLGVGGGTVIVPILLFIFTAQHFNASHMIHLAIGTSLASMLFTSASSVRAHHARDAVNWDIVKRITPGILIGTLTGTVLAARLPAFALQSFFTAFLFFVATQMLLNIKPKPARSLPNTGGMFAAGSLIGLISSLVGIGGGSMSVPFMTACNVRMHNAIGTSAAIGFPIAAAGAAGYLFNGLSQKNMPEWSIGYIHLPALAAIVSASMLVVPFGVRAAHRLPVASLKKIFALFLYLVGIKLLHDLM